MSPDQVQHELLVNGKEEEEFINGIDSMKNGKSHGVDEILAEQIKHFGPMSKQWLLDLYNNYRTIIKFQSNGASQK